MTIIDPVERKADTTTETGESECKTDIMIEEIVSEHPIKTGFVPCLLSPLPRASQPAWNKHHKVLTGGV